MTKEQKQLLLKDLYARQPYRVKISVDDDYDLFIPRLKYIDGLVCHFYECAWTKFIDEIKPYLRPMSSMTEEDVHEIRNRLNNLPIGRTITKENFEKCCDFLWFTKMSPFECVSEKMMDVVIGYLDENMFDYRGLIEMGLALDAPKGMYK